MIPTPEEIDDVAVKENPEFEESVKAYQEYKAKYWVHKEDKIEQSSV